MVTAPFVSNGHGPAGGDLLLDDPPPDETLPMVASAQSLANQQPAEIPDTSPGVGFLLDDPQADDLQPVVAVQQEADVGGGFTLDEAPADEVTDVRPASTALGAPADAPALPPSRADLPLSLKEADYREDLGVDANGGTVSSAAVPSAVLDFQAMYRIIREVAIADSGDDTYTAVSADREYTETGQAAFGRRHFGLGFGLVLFTQESGHLGSVLRLMRERDATTFDQIFGPDSESLLTITSAPTPEERLKPVAGELLWASSWVERFRRAGAVPAFQAAQNEEAIEAQFRPMLNVAMNLGFDTDRGLAMVFDRVVTRGLGGGLRWVVEAAGPLRTPPQLNHALELLGCDTVRDFQLIAGWTPQDGEFGVETHAALVGALRRQGIALVPTSEDLMSRLTGTATGPAKRRLIRLRDSAAFADSIYFPV